MHPVSTTSHQIRICPCGQPYKPNIGGVRSGRTGNLSVSGVLTAIESAITSRGQVPGLIQKLSEDVINRAEFLSVIDTLVQQIAILEQPAAVPETEAKKPGRKKAEPEQEK